MTERPLHEQEGEPLEERDITEGLHEHTPTRTPSPDAELERLRDEIKHLHKIRRSLKAKVEEQDMGIEEIQRSLRRRAARRQSLEDISQELAVAQRFLSTADSVSQVEVVSAVEALNEEIFQLTSIVADKVQVEKQQFLPEEQDTEFREQIPEWTLSKQAFLDVVVPSRLEDSLAIQIGWQAILSSCCELVMNAWDLVDGNLSEELARLYSGMSSQHDRVVMGRWRALTIAATGEPSSELRECLIEAIVKPLIALPVICGYIHTRESYEDLFDAFWERLTPLLDKCLQFRRTVGENITSMDIYSYLVASGHGYDHQKADLEYEDERDSETQTNEKKGVVACSLGLGLLCNRIPTQPEGRIQNEVILKPKVILSETLKDIISPRS